MPTYQVQYDLLQKAYWRIAEFKEFFGVGKDKAIALKKEVLEHCKNNQIRLFNQDKVPTEEIVKYFKINVNYIKRNK